MMSWFAEGSFASLVVLELRTRFGIVPLKIRRDPAQRTGFNAFAGRVTRTILLPPAAPPVYWYGSVNNPDDSTTSS